MADLPPDSSPVAIAAYWVSRITTITLTMVVPGLVGYWLDMRLGTRVVFLLVGFAAGMALAVWQLMQLTSRRGARKNRS